MFELVKEDFITIVGYVIFIVAFFAYMYVKTKKTKTEIIKYKQTKKNFSQDECDEYDDISEKVLINTTLTFDSSECVNANCNPPYVEASNVGIQLIKSELFNFSDIGEI